MPDGYMAAANSLLPHFCFNIISPFPHPISSAPNLFLVPRSPLPLTASTSCWTGVLSFRRPSLKCQSEQVTLSWLLSAFRIKCTMQPHSGNVVGGACLPLSPPQHPKLQPAKIDQAHTWTKDNLPKYTAATQSGGIDCGKAAVMSTKVAVGIRLERKD